MDKKVLGKESWLKSKLSRLRARADRVESVLREIPPERLTSIDVSPATEPTVEDGGKILAAGDPFTPTTQRIGDSADPYFFTADFDQSA